MNHYSLIMSTAIISLAAGKAERMGCEKHLLEFDGETLAARTERLFGRTKFITREDVPNTTCTCDTLCQSQMYWGDTVIVLLGDVYYTEHAARTILELDTTLAFFTDKQDIFAIKFGGRWKDHIHRLAMEAIRKKHNKGRLWECYRAILGLPKSAPMPHGDMLCWIIADETQDFDEPEDVEDFIRGKSKNKQLSSLTQKH